ncbi:Ctf8p and Ctf18p associating protein [Malassezia yamatoensis]|uniref:Ctf8p and Ctf18p associating protein n=1 Tax=Malassezia yamatoensis TaxID=253288 RepID=A0AAJ6CJK0_9BASI|nr:Ctf8p and Ctf18p associating protein [Malassezia yamatoensis]
MEPVKLVSSAWDQVQSYQLLEIPPELEANFLPGSDTSSLTLNGRLTDDATLSTSDRTYALRQVSQSNSLLLCGIESENSGEVPIQLRMHQNASDLIELVPTSARLDRLSSLLDASMYYGQDTLSEARQYTPQELRSIVQASDAELAEGLRTHHVLLLDGYMRRVAPSLLYRLLQVVLNQLDILACNPDQVPYFPTYDALQMSTRPEVAEKILCDWFCSPPRPTGIPTQIRLATQEIARFLGIHLLRENKRMPLLAFVQQWTSILTSLAEEAHLSLLHGFYLFHPAPASFTITNTHSALPLDPSFESLASSITIQYFPHTQLPLSPSQRFQDLFMTRSQWLREELLPFLQDLVDTHSKASNLDSLLIKHARSSRARWTRSHAAVLLRGEVSNSSASRTGGSEDCVLYQARVKY